MVSFSHKNAEIAHAVRRGEERHNLSLEEIVTIKQKIRNGESVAVERRSKRSCVHEVKHQGSHLYVVYDKKTHEVVTFLPCGWIPKNPLPNWAPPEKQRAYGGIPLDEEGRVLLRKVTDTYKGYVWTFAKGRPDEGETAAETALREVREETGYECEIKLLLGRAFDGLDTVTRYFIMHPLRDHGDFHAETCAVRWAHLDEAEYLLGLTEHEQGRQRDLAALGEVSSYLGY